MNYKIYMNDETFEGKYNGIILTAFDLLKNYVLDALEKYVKKEDQGKANASYRFLTEYFDAVIFLQKNGKGAVKDDLLTFRKMLAKDHEEFVKELNNSKNPTIKNIARQVRGEIDSSDIMEQFLSSVEDDEEFF